MKFSRAIVLILFCCLTAQAANEQRWLLIFNTSSAMKKRIPATEAEIGRLLADSAGGKLRAGDSIGVWVFDEKLRTGQYPLTYWQPSQTAGFVTNLTAFVRKQKYSGDTEFDSLQPMLNRVIADSERLTILIFCDGTDQIRWTPYDDGINNTLEQTAAERKKSQQPVIVLLRTQMGKYVGATVNFPPSPPNFPAFPLLPRELKPAVTNLPPAVAVAPVKAAPPAPPAAPLIIVGTHVSTNVEDLTKNTAPGDIATPAPVKTNPPATNAALPEVAKPALAVPAIKSNVPVAKTAPVAPPPTNAVANKPAAVAAITNPPAATTNLITAPVTTENHFSKTLIGIGAAAFVLAALLVGFLFGKQRRPQSSLITSSMQEEIPPPKRK